MFEFVQHSSNYIRFRRNILLFFTSHQHDHSSNFTGNFITEEENSLSLFVSIRNRHLTNFSRYRRDTLVNIVGCQRNRDPFCTFSSINDLYLYINRTVNSYESNVSFNVIYETSRNIERIARRKEKFIL